MKMKKAGNLLHEIQDQEEEIQDPRYFFLMARFYYLNKDFVQTERYLQKVIDDSKGHTLASASTLDPEMKSEKDG